VKAVTITDATQAVAPPRWSVTVMTPSCPLIVLALAETTCDPSETPLVGALIDSAPAVNVKVTGVPAPADTAIAAASVAKMPTIKQDFKNVT
jgi:hypothetical protein